MSQDSQGRYVPEPEPVPDGDLASAARTATFTGTPFDTSGLEELDATLDITARSGTTPTLDLALETTVNGSDWYSVGAFAQKNAVDNDARAFGPLGEESRWKGTLGGTTPSFTFSVTTKAER